MEYITLPKKGLTQLRTDLRNSKKLHQQARKRVVVLEKENKTLKAEIKELKKKDKEKDQRITDLSLQMEELRTIVFGKKKQPDDTCDRDEIGDKPVVRTKKSYQRPIPKGDEVTNKIHHTINTCPDCNTTLTKKTEKVWHEEDIILPTEKQSLKSVTEYTVEKGYCTHCRRWKSIIPLSTTPVLLGENIKIYICYLSILIRLSYTQIQTLLNTTFQITVSDGEIAKILEKESVRQRPAYEALKEDIRCQKGNHYDESSWRVQEEGQGHYVWGMTGTETEDVVFHCGRSRGKGNAEDLKGDSHAVGITDGYGAYHTLFDDHQLCWAHPYRKLRDLTESDTLTEDVRSHCRKVYEDFGALYAETQEVLDTPFKYTERNRILPSLMNTMEYITTPHTADPKKLKNIKTSLLKNAEKYFTCVLYDGIPMDNNKAERALRHLVIKRKTSFGSKTQRGAEVTSVLMSVLLSLYYRKPEDYFGELLGLRGV